jgi:hypothetical protein
VAEFVDDGGLEPDEAFALLVATATKPRGRVAAIASKAAAVVDIRIMAGM